MKPLVIYTERATPILEASIRKISRDVTRLELNNDELHQGRVGVSWNILEQNDGGVIQLIYSGKTTVGISVDGVIEGQPLIERLEFTGKIQSQEEQYVSWIGSNRSIRWLPAFLLIMLLALGGFHYVMTRVAKRMERISQAIIKLVDVAKNKGFASSIQGLDLVEQEFNRSSVEVRWSRAAKGILFVATIFVIGFLLLALFSPQDSGPPFGF